ncbi:MAG: hypothetical protein ACLQVJ_22335 [Syntrophobacteraceae bacterium]
MAVARLDSKSRYCVTEPEMVLDSGMLLNQLRVRSGGGSVLLGFDFPIGLPSTYCQIARICSFIDILPVFGKGCWANFYQVASDCSQISIYRPFYPYAPGGKSQQHLLNGLGIKEVRDLLRDCECPTSARPAASSLFWTLGAKQVGRAAIAGWRDVLAPAMRNNVPSVKFWPFSGGLNTLLGSSDIVIVETYPAEACVHIGLGAPGRGWSKRNQAHRQRFSPVIQAWAKAHGVKLEASLLALLNQGFGASGCGEDKFDAVIGLLAMLGIILDDDSYDAPPDTKVRTVEGWIFGLPAVV